MDPFLGTLAKAEDLNQYIRGEYLKGYAFPRIALVGRSNVGKSSLINALLGEPSAKTSKTPGKTRAINFFLWQDARRVLADLPGYGFAKVGAQEIRSWSSLIDVYFKNDPKLELVLILLDSRHGPTANDRTAIQFLSLLNIPVTFVFTKVDALKNQSERLARKREAISALRELGFDGDVAIWVSSHTQAGLSELVCRITEA